MVNRVVWNRTVHLYKNDLALITNKGWYAIKNTTHIHTHTHIYIYIYIYIYNTNTFGSERIAFFHYFIH